MATMTGLVALTIDAMLPALPDIGQDLLVSNPNDVQLVVGLIFLGMGLGQLFYGPLSDSVGRKPALTTGMGIFVIGSLCCLFAADFQMMLIGRLLQGIGLGAPRVVTMALVRDQYEGRDMARVMSFIMAIFILVPMIAPALGQLILLIADWRAIFTSILVAGVLIYGWFAWRQPETLDETKRRPFTLSAIGLAAREIVTNPSAIGYTVIAGLSSSAFLAYLSSIQQILAQQYQLGSYFPLVFAALALVVGGASFINGRLVMRFGMKMLVRYSLRLIIVASAGFSLYVVNFSGHPPLWSLMLFFSVVLFGTGLLFGNVNSIAMEPLGHIAGIGAAVVASISTLISVPVGIYIARAYDGSVIPLIMGFGGSWGPRDFAPKYCKNR